MDNQLVDQLYDRAIQMHIAREHLKAWETGVNSTVPKKKTRKLRRKVKQAEKQTQKAIQALVSSEGIGFFDENAASREVKELIAQLIERARHHAIENSFWGIVGNSVT